MNFLHRLPFAHVVVPVLQSAALVAGVFVAAVAGDVMTGCRDTSDLIGWAVLSVVVFAIAFWWALIAGLLFTFLAVYASARYAHTSRVRSIVMLAAAPAAAAIGLLCGLFAPMRCSFGF